MILVRESQIDVFRRVLRRRFEDQMVSHVRRRFPHGEFVLDDKKLREFVVSSIELAETFGIKEQFDLRRFIEFRAEYGENIHLIDWASRILNDKTLSGCGKMEQIDDFTLYVLR